MDMTCQIEELVNRLRVDFPDLIFRRGLDQDDTKWIPDEDTIVYTKTTSTSRNNDLINALVLLHELAHASLGHSNFDIDAELLRMETEAWQLVELRFAPKYGVNFILDVVDMHIKSYRDWLSDRSMCPRCGMIGWQTAASTYSCPSCSRSWSVGSNKFKNTYRSMK